MYKRPKKECHILELFVCVVDLGMVEDEIFKKRRETDVSGKNNVTKFIKTISQSRSNHKRKQISKYTYILVKSLLILQKFSILLTLFQLGFRMRNKQKRRRERQVSTLVFV